jgi:hypothetical protein
MFYLLKPKYSIFNLRYPGAFHMKNLVRAFVVVLALTGAAASTRIASASDQSNVTVSKTSAIPIPMCPPDDPNACGIDQ